MQWFLQGMLDAFLDILKSPFVDLSILWVLIPIISLWLVLEIYFGRYKSESLGWNTALGNGISLLWVNIENMRYLFSQQPENFLVRFIPVGMIIFYGIFIVYISFTHKFSSKITYALAAPTPIYFLSSVSALWGHGSLKLTWFVIFDLFMLYLFCLIIFTLIRRFLPEVSEEEKGKFDFSSGSSERSGLGTASRSDKFSDIKNLKL
jgi:hypothetical protein